MSDPSWQAAMRMKSMGAKRVILEPELERVAGCWDAATREDAARIYYRWAKQLWVTARALRTAAGERPRAASKSPVRCGRRA